MMLIWMLILYMLKLFSSYLIDKLLLCTKKKGIVK
jgi:hypothetical protein